MWIKFLFLMFVLIALRPGLVSAQSGPNEPPDFSGTWVLYSINDQKVEPYKAKHEGLRLTLIISQTGPSLKIVTESFKKGITERYEGVYYTDGRGEENPSTTGDKPRHSKTTWKKNVLVRKFSVRPMPNSNSFVVSSDEWKLSKDGQTLTQTSRNVSAPSTVGAGSLPQVGSRTYPTMTRVVQKRSFKRV
jgi:hypothetical protein